MVAVAIQSAALPATTIKWLNPAPLWGMARTTAPHIAEFESDQFLPDFLAMMGGTMDLNLPIPQADPSGVLKLYQPLHQRYYLVTGSLVCRQFGIPDRTVARKNGERTSFVLRRTIDGQEYAWINNGPQRGWQPLQDEKGRPVLVRKDEERLPLHQVKACLPTQAAKRPCEQRMVYYGYIPVSSREKYLAPVPLDVQQAAVDGALTNPRLDEFSTRVLEPWRGLYVTAEGKPLDSGQVPPAEEQRQTSLHVLLNLGDFLQNQLPDVFTALTTQKNLPPDATSRQKLLDELKNITLKTDAGDVPLFQAINELKAYVDGDGPEPAPGSYNLYAATSSYGASDPLLADGELVDQHDVTRVYAPTYVPGSDKTYTVPVNATYHQPTTSKDSNAYHSVYFLAQDGRLYTLLQAALDEQTGDQRMDEFATRVLDPWRGLHLAADGTPLDAVRVPNAEQREQISLYLLLDLGDFLQTHLPAVLDALIAGQSLSSPDATSRQRLLDELNGIKGITRLPILAGKNTSDIPLAEAMTELKAYLSLVHGEGPDPPALYNVYAATSTYVPPSTAGSLQSSSVYATYYPNDGGKDIPAYFLAHGGRLYALVRAALDEQTKENIKEGKPGLKLPAEASGMVKNDPAAGDNYFLRLVYEHTPCAPVVSERSELFTFAKVFDPDAPARQIRIEMPSVKLKDLRKFKRGVGIEMSPELQKVMNGVHTGMLKGEKLIEDATASGYTMICIFSIPIITILALIVMFIFLILFNIIFWWLPFIWICIRIPRRQ